MPLISDSGMPRNHPRDNRQLIFLSIACYVRSIWRLKLNPYSGNTTSSIIFKPYTRPIGTALPIALKILLPPFSIHYLSLTLRLKTSHRVIYDHIWFRVPRQPDRSPFLYRAQILALLGMCTRMTLALRSTLKPRKCIFLLISWNHIQIHPL